MVIDADHFITGSGEQWILTAIYRAAYRNGGTNYFLPRLYVVLLSIRELLNIEGFAGA